MTYQGPPMYPPYVPPVGRLMIRPRRGRLRVTLAVLAAVCLVAGLVDAALALTSVSSPRATVGSYFSALRRADAPKALSLGVPAVGDTHLLTSSVLAQQQRIGPIHDVVVGAVRQSANAADVAVSYRIGGSGPPNRNETIALRRKGNGWELDRTSSSVTIHFQNAAHRATLGGAALPTNAVRMFPGDIPIGFDTRALQVDPTLKSVTLSADAAVEIRAVLSSDGRASLSSMLDTAAKACLSSPAVPCGLAPAGSRCVPGTLRGTIGTPPSAGSPAFELAPGNADGLITVTGTFMATVRWTSLDFENQPVGRHGSVSIGYAASFYVSSPKTILWKPR